VKAKGRKWVYFSFVKKMRGFILDAAEQSPDGFERLTPPHPHLTHLVNLADLDPLFQLPTVRAGYREEGDLLRREFESSGQDPG